MPETPLNFPDIIHHPDTQLNPAEATPLTPYNEEFYLPQIMEGQDVKIGASLSGGDIYIHCDFQTFAPKLEVVHPQKLKELFIQSDQLKPQFPDMTTEQREIIHACWRAGRITKNLLGNVATEQQRNDSFADYSTIINSRPASLKPLSAAVNQAMCSEYSLLAHHILQRLDIDSSVVIGAFAANPQEKLAGRHTYLTIESGQLIFDPTHTIQQEQSWPPVILAPQQPATVKTLQQLSTQTDQPFGCKIPSQNIISGQVSLYGSGAS